MLQHIVRALSIGLIDDQLRSPTASALLSEAALRLIFESFSNAFTERSNREPTAAMPRQIKAAIEYMHENLHQPLTLGSIAEAAGVGSRSLQAGFQRLFDASPLAYLRDMRLQAAHAELSYPDNRLSVREIALKWGFTHMGRFSAQYRAVFGVSPSETSRLAGGKRSWFG